MRIAFEPDVVDRGVPVGGLVSWRRAIEYVNQIPTDETTAEIRVRTHNPWARGMSFEQMRHEVAHELGHVLGLDDSRRLGAVMSPLDLRRPVGKVGDDELEALHRLRDLAAEVRREALEYAMRV
ncbi:MAG: hypothetical protein HYR64_02215 [Fimbriimonas ginsengisoli]|uniref:Peptidase M10 metallopeptidase domain-containing protein n=1 Tax=Fimbriimonas ginsengisoli TaxID=1005039 RepID=A0A931LW03_FIMGI|nr:hypothetical protein [Fimbriimonas ginsengisoli]